MKCITCQNPVVKEREENRLFVKCDKCGKVALVELNSWELKNLNKIEYVDLDFAKLVYKKPKSLGR